MTRGKIYLFPSLLSPVPASNVLPALNLELMRGVRYFVVEDLRSARRFLKACDRSIVIDDLHFELLNEHTHPDEVDAMLAPALEGHDMGVISEAGCPAVADPGADLVAAAQRRGVEVVPLVGPSSILMSLMGSGFNGQSFTFLGYLPVDARRRADRLRDMEREIRRDRRTQIFIETPYRNRKLFEEILQVLNPNTLLSIACDITTENEYIKTMSIREWKTQKPDIHKRPAIFLFYAG